MGRPGDPAPAPAGRAVPCAPTRLVVLQPTTYCNLRCSYCYLPLTAQRRRMDLATVAAVGRFLGGIEVSAVPLTVSWHSGEPLTVGVDFYRAAVQTLRDAPGCPPLRHTVQTNATLVDDRWCAFFVEWDVEVGVSLDGPEDLHDAFRLDRHGRGTFRRVVAGVRRLRSHGLDPSVIAVLTEESLQRPDDVWNALTGVGFRKLAFNVVESEGANTQRTGRRFATDVRTAYEHFLVRVAELRAQHPDVRVRELDDMRRFVTTPAPVHSIENLPGAIISISAAGDVSTFSPELVDLEHPRYGPFVWGNVHRDTWAQVCADPRFVATADSIRSGVDRCARECGYFSVCGGGAPSNKLGEHDTFDATETLDCRLRVQAVTEAFLRTAEVGLVGPAASAAASPPPDGSVPRQGRVPQPLP